MIRSSLEWNNIEIKLRRQARGWMYEGEILRMINNIQSEIVLLSKAEVDARRGNTLKSTELLERINNDIEMIEEYLIVAALIG